MQTGETTAAFVIAADGKVIIVWIRRAEPFRRTPGELDAENHEQLALFRSFPGSADIIREFWVYSKYGSLRFFRMEDSRLLEIGRDGLPLAARGGKAGAGKTREGQTGSVRSWPGMTPPSPIAQFPCPVSTTPHLFPPIYTPPPIPPLRRRTDPFQGWTNPGILRAPIPSFRWPNRTNSPKCRTNYRTNSPKNVHFPTWSQRP